MIGRAAEAPGVPLARRGPAEYVEAIRRVLDESARQTGGHMEDVRGLLLRWREQLVRDLAALPPDRFSAAQQRRVIAELDVRIKELEARLRPVVDAAVRDAAKNGRRAVVGPLNAARSATLNRAGSVVPVINETALRLAADNAGDMIKDLTADLSRSVRLEIQRVIVGGGTPYDAIQRVAGELDKAGAPGASTFATTFHRAEMIVRTETGGAFNRAHNESIKQLADRVPGLLQKTWIAVGDMRSRPEHAAMNGTTVPADQKFILRVLRGRDAGTYEVDGPHDPILPASQIVGCRCDVATSPIPGTY